MAPEAIVRLGISHVPEGRRIFPGLTVTREHHARRLQSRAAVEARQMDEEVEEMFAIFPDLKRLSNALGLEALRRPAADARGGARTDGASRSCCCWTSRRSASRRSSCSSSSPSSAQIRERGTTILLVEQNAHMALSVADRGYVLETGALTVEGSPEQLLDNEEVRAAYLGGTQPVEPVLSTSKGIG